MSEHQHHHHRLAGGTGAPGEHFCVNDGTRLTLHEIEGRMLEGCDRCGFVLWRDPKLATAALVLDGEGRLVIARRATEPGYGLWCLPGGFVNDDEHPCAAAARECREEIGADVVLEQLVGVYHAGKQGAASLVVVGYAGRLGDGASPAPGPEMLEVASVPLPEVPELVFSTHREALADWLRGRG